MFGLRIGISGALGVLVTLGLIYLMYQLIDSGHMEIDNSVTPKIPDALHVERDPTENAKMTQTDELDDPQPPPDLPEHKDEFQMQEDTVIINPSPPSDDIVIDDGIFKKSSDYVPIYVPQPKYPRRAITYGKEGYAVVEVIVTTVGNVRDPVLIEEWPEGWKFGSAALKAAGKLKYNPRVIDGVAQEVPGVLYKFTFQMAN